MSVLCKDGLERFWSKVKSYFTGTATPLMDGTAAVGSSHKFAREDHVHPSDTSKQNVLTAGDNIQISGDTISATDTTYSISKSGNTVTLTGSDGNTSTFTDANTTYTATSPISISSSNVISHDNSGVSAATYGTNSATALTPDFGATFSVPGFAVDAKGHVTSASSHTVKMPNSAASTTAAGLMSAADKIKLNAIGTVYTNTVAQHAITSNNIDNFTRFISTTVPAGTYIVIGRVSFAASSSNVTSARGIEARLALLDQATTESGFIASERVYCSNSQWQVLNAIGYRTVTAQTTFSLYASTTNPFPANSNAARITAIRVA